MSAKFTPNVSLIPKLTTFTAGRISAEEVLRALRLLADQDRNPEAYLRAQATSDRHAR
jgi:hypothetical protein